MPTPATTTVPPSPTLAGMDKIHIGQLVRNTRLAKGISFRELGEITGLSTRSIRQIEDAENNYGVDTLATVCKVLDLELTVVAKVKRVTKR